MPNEKVEGEGVEGFLTAILTHWSQDPQAHPLLTGFQLGLVTAFAYPDYARAIHATLADAQVSPTMQEVEQVLLAYIADNPIQAYIEEPQEG